MERTGNTGRSLFMKSPSATVWTLLLSFSAQAAHLESPGELLKYQCLAHTSRLILMVVLMGRGLSVFVCSEEGNNGLPHTERRNGHCLRRTPHRLKCMEKKSKFTSGTKGNGTVRDLQGRQVEIQGVQ